MPETDKITDYLGVAFISTDSSFFGGPEGQDADHPRPILPKSEAFDSSGLLGEKLPLDTETDLI